MIKSLFGCLSSCSNVTINVILQKHLAHVISPLLQQPQPESLSSTSDWQLWRKEELGLWMETIKNIKFDCPRCCHYAVIVRFAWYGLLFLFYTYTNCSRSDQIVLTMMSRNIPPCGKLRIKVKMMKGCLYNSNGKLHMPYHTFNVCMVTLTSTIRIFFMYDADSMLRCRVLKVFSIFLL